MLKIYEIFYSLQGESSRVGLPTTFVRLSGCPMRCSYCDTTYAFQGGRNMSIVTILSQVATCKAHYVTVTGGEPLAQKQTPILLTALCDAGYSVSLETGGGFSIATLDQRVMVVLDIKTPASGELTKNVWQNIALLKSSDEVKFVLNDRQDYDWAKRIVDQYQLTDKCTVLFSPVYAVLNSTKLADWLVADKLAVRMQVQLHKILWGEVSGK